MTGSTDITTSAGAFSLEVRLGNEAMESADHVACALERIAVELRAGRTTAPVRDGNGNSVGSWRLVPASA